MHTISYYCKDRDPQEVFVPLIRGMFPGTEMIERPCTEHPLRGYHELVTADPITARDAGNAMGSLVILQEVLAFNDSKTVTNDEADQIRKMIGDSL